MWVIITVLGALVFSDELIFLSKLLRRRKKRE